MTCFWLVHHHQHGHEQHWDVQNRCWAQSPPEQDVSWHVFKFCVPWRCCNTESEITINSSCGQQQGEKNCYNLESWWLWWPAEVLKSRLGTFLILYEDNNHGNWSVARCERPLRNQHWRWCNKATGHNGRMWWVIPYWIKLVVWCFQSGWSPYPFIRIIHCVPLIKKQQKKKKEIKQASMMAI